VKGILRKSNAADPGADQAEGISKVPFVWLLAVSWSTAISGLRELWCGLGEVVVMSYSAYIVYSRRSCQHGACRCHRWHRHRPHSLSLHVGESEPYLN